MAKEGSLCDLGEQQFLRHAMSRLGMTRDAFAARISVPRRALDKWLLPSDSKDFRALPEIGRAYFTEILSWAQRF